MFPCKDITLNNSLVNTIIFPSQRLVTTSANLRTQTVLHCLILWVLNIKSLFPKCLSTILFTSVVTNLEHGLVTLTESFSPLESELHNLPCWSPKQKCALSYAIPFYTMYTTTSSRWSDLVWAGHSHFNWRDYEAPKTLWNFPLHHTLFIDAEMLSWFGSTSICPS